MSLKAGMTKLADAMSEMRRDRAHDGGLMTYDAFAAALAADALKFTGNEFLTGDLPPEAWLHSLMALMAAGHGPLARMAREFIATEAK